LEGKKRSWKAKTRSAENQNYQPALVNGLKGAQGENQKLFPTEGYWLFMREDGTLAAISA